MSCTLCYCISSCVFWMLSCRLIEQIMLLQVLWKAFLWWSYYPCVRISEPTMKTCGAYAQYWLKKLRKGVIATKLQHSCCFQTFSHAQALHVCGFECSLLQLWCFYVILRRYWRRVCKTKCSACTAASCRLPILPRTSIILHIHAAGQSMTILSQMGFLLPRHFCGIPLGWFEISEVAHHNEMMLSCEPHVFAQKKSRASTCKAERLSRSPCCASSATGKWPKYLYQHVQQALARLWALKKIVGRINQESTWHLLSESKACCLRMACCGIS